MTTDPTHAVDTTAPAAVPLPTVCLSCGHRYDRPVGQPCGHTPDGGRPCAGVLADVLSDRGLRAAYPLLFVWHERARLDIEGQRRAVSAAYAGAPEDVLHSADWDDDDPQAQARRRRLLDDVAAGVAFVEYDPDDPRRERIVRVWYRVAVTMPGTDGYAALMRGAHNVRAGRRHDDDGHPSACVTCGRHSERPPGQSCPAPDEEDVAAGVAVPGECGGTLVAADSDAGLRATYAPMVAWLQRLHTTEAVIAGTLSRAHADHAPHDSFALVHIDHDAPDAERSLAGMYEDQMRGQCRIVRETGTGRATHAWYRLTGLPRFYRDELANEAANLRAGRHRLDDGPMPGEHVEDSD